MCLRAPEPARAPAVSLRNELRGILSQHGRSNVIRRGIANLFHVFGFLVLPMGKQSAVWVRACT